MSTIASRKCTSFAQWLSDPPPERRPLFHSGIAAFALLVLQTPPSLGLQRDARGSAARIPPPRTLRRPCFPIVSYAPMKLRRPRPRVERGPSNLRRALTFPTSALRPRRLIPPLNCVHVQGTVDVPELLRLHRWPANPWLPTGRTGTASALVVAHWAVRCGGAFLNCLSCLVPMAARVLLAIGRLSCARAVSSPNRCAR